MRVTVKEISGIALCLLLVSFLGTYADAGSGRASSTGQSVYVPVYSYVYHGDRGQVYNLTATLSVRNTDPSQPITVFSVKYYDSNGKAVKEYQDKPKELGPLSSVNFVVQESDVTGGYGPCFIVKWKSSKPVSSPLIEAVMIGAASTQGISFVLQGTVIEE